MHESLHCSIIGTCLTCKELRKILSKVFGATFQNRSDHELHTEAVALANKAGGPSKLLNKALDARHAPWITRFSHARTASDVADLWRKALHDGDIPGAYWALMTHSATDTALIRRAFGDVHMLSHLVGSANRADIRRLTELQAEIERLQVKVDMQQARLNELAAARDEKNEELERLKGETILVTARLSQTAGSEQQNEFIRKLERRLAREVARRCALEEQQAAWREETRLLQTARSQTGEVVKSEDREANAPFFIETHGASTEPLKLLGRSILYVGGRPQSLGAIRSLVEASGGVFQKHDGGIEDSLTILPGLISRADRTFFPTDCVSHSAVQLIKKTCRQLDRQWVALPRSSAEIMRRALNQH